MSSPGPAFRRPIPLTTLALAFTRDTIEPMTYMIASALVPPVLHSAAPFVALVLAALTALCVSTIASAPYALGRVRGLIAGVLVGVCTGGLLYHVMRGSERAALRQQTATAVWAVPTAR